MLHFLSSKPLDIFTPWLRKCTPNGPAIRRFLSSWMAISILLSRSIRQCESMHGNARTFSEQVKASIIYDGRSGMSVVTFRIAPPIGGLVVLLAFLNKIWHVMAFSGWPLLELIQIVFKCFFFSHSPQWTQWAQQCLEVGLLSFRQYTRSNN